MGNGNNESASPVASRAWRQCRQLRTVVHTGKRIANAQFFFPGPGHGRAAVPLKARGGRTGLWPGSPPFEPFERYWGEAESNLVGPPPYLPYSYF